MSKKNKNAKRRKKGKVLATTQPQALESRKSTKGTTSAKIDVLEYASLRDRLKVVGIDLLFSSLLVLVLFLVGDYFNPHKSIAHLGILIYYFLFAAPYYIGTWAWWGASPGMVLVNLRLVDEEGYKSIPFTQLISRYLRMYEVIFSLGFTFFSLQKNEQHQTRHDFKAHTVVVKVPHRSFRELVLGEAS